MILKHMLIMMTRRLRQIREEILNSMQECGIDRIVNACASLESLKDTELLWKNIRLFMVHLESIRMMRIR